MHARWSFGRSTLTRGAMVCLLFVAACTGHGKKNGTEVAISPGPGSAVIVAEPSKVVETPGLAIDAEHTVGPPIVIGNLAVFPIYAKVMEDLGDFIPLDDALEKNVAVVRELGAEQPGTDGPPLEQRVNDPRQQVAYRGDGARVNTLVIENKGDVPILVLAGTVVKGGKQDRQIGQDFIIGKKQTVPVDAFCVEHGRWNPTRNGVATGGSFKSLKTLAAGDVRAAGQYEKDQSQVWSKVGKINKATGKQTASDTLTASLEAPEAQEERSRLGAQIHGFLISVPMAERTVGMAYAVGGEVQAARFFIHHKLFDKYEETLVSTAVVESYTQGALARAEGKAVAPGAAGADKVVAFVAGAAGGKREQRDTAGENVNQYEMGDKVYASDVQMKSKTPAAKPKSVTKDYLKKK